MRRANIAAAVVVVLSAMAALTGNIATGNLPDAWRPWLWLAWPSAAILVIATIAIEMRRKASGESVVHADGNGAIDIRSALDLLASAEPRQRTAGARAFALCADSGQQKPQWYVDVLCDQVRHSPVSDPAGQHETRVAIFDVIRERLKGGSSSGWKSCRFDFSGVVLDGLSLDGASIDGGRVILDRAIFTASPSGEVGGLSWRRGSFRNCSVSFTDSRMTELGLLDLSGGHVENSVIDLRNLQMTGGHVKFRRVQVRAPRYDVPQAPIELSGATLSAGEIDFTECELGDRATLERLRGAPVNFPAKKAVLIPYWSAVSFNDATLSGTKLQFRATEVVDGSISFDHATIAGSWLDFPRTFFYQGGVSFVEAKIESGIIEFFGSHLWHYGSDIDDVGMPKFLTDLSSRSPDERRQMEYNHVGLPNPTVSFVLATLGGGEIKFSGIDVAPGTVVDFNHATFQGTHVSVRSSDLKGSIFVLWHLYTAAGGWLFKMEDSDTAVLFSSNMTAAERAGFDLPFFIVPFEIRDTH